MASGNIGVVEVSCFFDLVVSSSELFGFLSVGKRQLDKPWVVAEDLVVDICGFQGVGSPLGGHVLQTCWPLHERRPFRKAWLRVVRVLELVPLGTVEGELA